MSFRVDIATREQFELAYQIRVNVFVHEQQIAIEEELDEQDPLSVHFIVFETLTNKPVATCRLVPDKDHCHLGRMCILEEYRSIGLGKLMSDKFDTEARKLGYKTITIHAQKYAQPFYEKIGYQLMDKPSFFEVGIEHVHMAKYL
jgi:predicted GNAT family N-acyltransferase